MKATKRCKNRIEMMHERNVQCVTSYFGWFVMKSQGRFEGVNKRNFLQSNLKELKKIRNLIKSKRFESLRVKLLICSSISFFLNFLKFLFSSLHSPQTRFMCHNAFSTLIPEISSPRYARSSKKREAHSVPGSRY